jgi:hypothetical protein
VYRFMRKVSATGEYVKYGAFHTGEVPYAYNNLRFVDRPWQKWINSGGSYVRLLGQLRQKRQPQWSWCSGMKR